MSGGEPGYSLIVGAVEGGDGCAATARSNIHGACRDIEVAVSR